MQDNKVRPDDNTGLAYSEIVSHRTWVQDGEYWIEVRNAPGQWACWQAYLSERF